MRERSRRAHGIPGIRLGAIAWRNVLRNKRRSLLSASAIAVVAAALSFGFAFFGGMKKELAYNVQTFTSGHVKIANPAWEKSRMLNPLHLGVADGEAVVRWVEAKPETAVAVPRISFEAWIQRGDRRRMVRGIGLDFTREKAYSDYPSLLVRGREPASGAREVVVGERLAADLGLDVGGKFTFTTITRDRSLYGVTVAVVGIARYPVPALSVGTFAASIVKVQEWLRMDGSVIEVLAKLRDGRDANLTAAGWNDAMATRGLEAASWEKSDITYALMQFVTAIYNSMAVMLALLGSTVVVNTTMMVIFERRGEIGALGAMGMRGGELVAMFFVESVIIAIGGVAAGSAVGSGVTLCLAKTGINLGGLMNGIELDFPSIVRPAPTLATTASAAGLAVAVAGIASLLPAWMAARVRPVDALRE